MQGKTIPDEQNQLKMLSCTLQVTPRPPLCKFHWQELFRHSSFLLRGNFHSGNRQQMIFSGPLIQEQSFLQTLLFTSCLFFRIIDPYFSIERDLTLFIINYELYKDFDNKYKRDMNNGGTPWFQTAPLCMTVANLLRNTASSTK